MNQHLDKMALKLVKVAVLVVSAIDLASGGNCNSSRNSDVLERAFGQVINSKLENQTMIMLEQMQDTFIQVLNDKLDSIFERQEILETKLQEQNVTLEELKFKSDEEHETLLKEIVYQSIQPSNSNETTWFRILNSHIWLSSKKANFDKASEICSEMDARLYEPQSLLHNQLVYSLMKAKGREEYDHLIGIHDKYEEGL